MTGFKNLGSSLLSIDPDQGWLTHNGAAMDTLNFDDLRLFERLAVLGTLSALARERQVPVSQVSRALARIEQRCGARLVHRSTQGLRLTPEGERFLEHGRRIGAALSDLEADFAGRSARVEGLVRVAASTLVALQVLRPSLASLAERHPLLQIDLVVSDQEVDLVREGIDIAIRTSAHPPPDRVARPLGTLTRALFAAPAYAARHGLPQHPDELPQHRLVTHSGAPQLNRWTFQIDGQWQEREVRGHWSSDNSQVLTEMVADGLGIGRLSSLVSGPLLAQGRLLPVLPSYALPQTLTIQAVYPGPRERLPKIRACVDHWTAWLGRA